MSNDLRLAARGIGWNYLGSGAILSGQVVYTALTARLISPAGFGAYAAAQALFSLISYFAVASVGSALIRHERQGRHVVGTAFVISIMAGAGASLVVFLIASLWAGLWDVPESASVGRLFSVVVLLTAVSVIPLALLRQSLDYRRAALIESVAQVLGMGVGVALAYHLRSPTALVIGQAAAAGLAASAALLASRKELAVEFSPGEARSLLAFSGHVTTQSIVYYGLYTAPSLVISRMFGTASLGIYSRANFLVTLPTTHLWRGVTRTLYPLIARARGDVGRLRTLIESTTIATTGLAWPLFAAVAGASPLVVEVLLGSRFLDAATLLPPVLLFGAVNFAYVVAGNPLEVLGFQRVIWRFQLLWVCLLGTALAVGALANLSMPLLLWLVAGVQVVVHAAKLRATAGLGLVRLGPIARAYGVTLALSALFFVVTTGVERATSGSDLLVGRAATEVVAVIATASLTTAFLRSTPFGRSVRGGLGLLRRRLGVDPQPQRFVEANHAEGKS